jgi:hypothetical protein
MTAEDTLRRILADVQSARDMDVVTDIAIVRRKATEGAVTLWRLRSKAARAAVYAYLEEVARDGLVGRVTS